MSSAKRPYLLPDGTLTRSHWYHDCVGHYRASVVQIRDKARWCSTEMSQPTTCFLCGKIGPMVSASDLLRPATRAERKAEADHLVWYANTLLRRAKALESWEAR